MNAIRSAGAAALALCLCMTAPAVAQPPVEAFGSLPLISKPSLAPDGKHFAVVQAVQGRPIVAIYEVGAAQGVKPALVAAPDGRIQGIHWAKNDRLVIFLKTNMHAPGDTQMRTWGRAVSVDAQGKNPVILMQNIASMRYNSSERIVDLNPADPINVYMPLWASDLDNPRARVVGSVLGVGQSQSVGNDSFVFCLYKVNVVTGEGTLAYRGVKWTNGWVMDGNGRVVARIDSYPDELKIHLKVPAGNDWRDIGSLDMTAGGNEDVAGIAVDGGLALTSPIQGRTLGLVSIDLTSLTRKTLYSHPTYDLADTIEDEWTGRIIGAGYIDDVYHSVYFDPARQKLQSALERAFPGHTVIISTCDSGARACIVRTESPKDPPAYYYFETATMHAFSIGAAYPQITAADLGEMKPYPYAARDGTQIRGYLTLPPGRDPHNLPVVVMPHGGPDARDFIAFDWWAQFLANRGYAVLQPNFRGSSGYGGAFTHAGLHQWGLKMQDDVTDGVQKLVADGIVDPKRVCIVGASYGGYAALAGVTLSPDVYACAVSYAGLADLEEMLRDEERENGAESIAVSFWKSRIGDRHVAADAVRIAATSPALHADQVRAPVLLLHATGDTTVPIDQSRRMRDALQRAHKNVSYIEISGDDHYIDLAETRIRVLSEIEKFLAANIGR